VVGVAGVEVVLHPDLLDLEPGPAQGVLQLPRRVLAKVAGIGAIRPDQLEGIRTEQHLHALPQRDGVRRLQQQHSVGSEDLAQVCQHQLGRRVEVFDHLGEDDDVVATDVRAPAVGELGLVQVEVKMPPPVDLAVGLEPQRVDAKAELAREHRGQRRRADVQQPGLPLRPRRIRPQRIEEEGEARPVEGLVCRVCIGDRHGAGGRA